MNPVHLTAADIAIAGTLLLADGLLSVAFGLRLHRPLAIAAARLVVQLTLVGFLLRAVFALQSPAVTLLLILLMTAIAAREAAARPNRRLGRLGNIAITGAAVAGAMAITVALALATALRPQPWWNPQTAIPLAGIVLGTVLNAASLSLDALLGGVARERAAIEARLALGERAGAALRPLVRDAARRGLLPIVNQMSAAGIVTLPGIMTGQILAGMDPIAAVKYQILLMFLLAGGGFLAAVGTAWAAARRLTDARDRLRLDRLTG